LLLGSGCCRTVPQNFIELVTGSVVKGLLYFRRRRKFVKPFQLPKSNPSFMKVARKMRNNEGTLWGDSKARDGNVGELMADATVHRRRLVPLGLGGWSTVSAGQAAAVGWERASKLGSREKIPGRVRGVCDLTQAGGRLAQPNCVRIHSCPLHCFSRYLNFFYLGQTSILFVVTPTKKTTNLYSQI
jgi:hypothetical protein